MKNHKSIVTHLTPFRFTYFRCNLPSPGKISRNLQQDCNSNSFLQLCKLRNFRVGELQETRSTISTILLFSNLTRKCYC
ncbi:hypothetical protein L1987_11692 [Smallanthus sonchifolius]|uniref:Uncharacterized protein n=1 Tax=Smallanthus sonchifolius TaxID=185202 RepID=A0ACB9JCL5_9ASTR|nr:hypothetical protein L1987_11692 [Smallanthus sonchifolius]